MAGEQPLGTTLVAGQEGDRVLVSLPMVGFPEGFQLRRGERVVLVEEESGLAVRPLLLKPRILPAEESASSERLKVQKATVHADMPASDRAPPGSTMVFEVDPGELEEPQVIAVRTPR